MVERSNTNITSNLLKLKQARVIIAYLTALLFTVVVLTFILPHDETDYIYAFFDKEALLSSMQNRRKIVFIGGSNLAFGIASNRVKAAYPEYEVVNMGLHAAIGLRLMIDQIKPYMNKDDVIIIMPEYEQFTSMFYGNSSSNLINLVSYNPKLIRHVSMFHVKNLIEPIPTRLKHGLSLLTSKKSDASNNKGRIYYRKAFDEYGDVVSHIGIVKREIKQKDDRLKGGNINEDFLVNKKAVDYLRRFSIECKRKGILLFLAYPALMNSAYAGNESMINSIHDQLESINNLTILYTPKASLFPDKYFTDTGYHMFRDKACDRTISLISYMNRYIHSEKK